MNALSPATANIILWVVTGILIFALTILHLARCCKKPQWIVRKLKWLRTFYAWIGALAILGGTWAFFLPVAISSGFTKNDDGPTLRQLLIYTTGGILGVITLGETRRKNDQEHIRQVHAERRSRYATAIEQLADEKAPIRLGGVYTLVKLIDEWLGDEKTLPSEEERRQEGQIIINSLCAYIRSSFDLVSKADVLSNSEVPDHYEGGVQQFTIDQARLREEKELRTTILGAIKIRLNGGIIHHQNGTQEISKGSWSDFDYDFSNAIFFYCVDFNDSYFGNSTTFTGATFTGDKGIVYSALFSNTVFIEEANFPDAIFYGACFSGAIFKNNVDFTKVKFLQSRVNIQEIIFIKNHIKDIDFSNTIFKGANNNFFGSEFHGTADFSKAKFIGFSASFTDTKFLRGASFYKANFKHAVFRAEFIENINFSKTEFTEVASFYSSRFIKGGVNFKGTIFKKFNPIFQLNSNNESSKAKFSYKVYPENYNFEVSPESPYEIETREQEHNGIKFIIPKDSELFDPDEPSEQEDNDDN